MSDNKGGRPSVFSGKEHRVQGKITARGLKLFEAHRVTLAKLTTAITGKPMKPAQVSDSDVIDYLARGEDETIAYLERK